MVGVESNFTHALIAATPDGMRGGIGKHKDGECEPGSALLALGLAGSRTVKFELPHQGWTEVKGDYLLTNGMHVDTFHEVTSDHYTLSITWRVKKRAKTNRVDTLTAYTGPATYQINSSQSLDQDRRNLKEANETNSDQLEHCEPDEED